MLFTCVLRSDAVSFDLLICTWIDFCCISAVSVNLLICAWIAFWWLSANSIDLSIRSWSSFCWDSIFSSRVLFKALMRLPYDSLDAFNSCFHFSSALARALFVVAVLVVLFWSDGATFVLDSSVFLEVADFSCVKDGKSCSSKIVTRGALLFFRCIFGAFRV